MSKQTITILVSVITAVALLALYLQRSQISKNDNRDLSENAQPKPVPMASQNITESGANNLHHSSTPEPKIEGAQRVKHLAAELTQEKNTAEFVQAKWQEYWHPAFNQQWKPTAKLNSVSQLLADLVSKQGPSFHEIIKSEKEVWAKDPEQKTSALALGVLCVGLFTSTTGESPNPATELPKLFRARQNEMPLTVGDVLTYQIVEEASAFLESRPSLPDKQLSGWITLGQATNPIYRLIALKTFSNFDTTPEQASRFYTPYLSESEPALNTVLAERLTQRGDAWALSLLPQVKAKLPLSK